MNRSFEASVRIESPTAKDARTSRCLRSMGRSNNRNQTYFKSSNDQQTSGVGLRILHKYRASVPSILRLIDNQQTASTSMNITRGTEQDILMHKPRVPTDPIIEDLDR